MEENSFENCKKNIRKKRKEVKRYLKIKNKFKGFTLIELLAVIVILALIMVIAIPSVLTTLSSAQVKSLTEYSTKSVKAAEEKNLTAYLEDDVVNECIVYDITSDFGFKTTGDYKGWVLYVPQSEEYYITISDGKYMIVGLNYTKYSSNMDDYIVDADESSEKFTIAYLCGRSLSCTSCTYTATDPTSSSSKETLDDVEYTGDYSFLKTGEEINTIWKTLAGTTTGKYSGNTNIKAFKFTTNDAPEGAELLSNKGVKVYTWFDSATGTIYYTSDALDIYLASNSSWLFSNFNNATSIDLTHFNTSNVTNMEGLFYKCSNVTSLDISNWDTSNVTNMNMLFRQCNKLANLDVKKLNTSKVTTMINMFSYVGFTTLDLRTFDTSKVTNMAAMFYGSDKLTTLDITGWDTSKVESFNLWGMECYGMKEIKGITNLNMQSNTDVSGMFTLMVAIPSIDISGWKNTGKIREWAGLFADCQSMTSVNLSNLDTSGAYDMSGMFVDCKNLKTIDVSSFDTRNVKYFGNRKYPYNERYGINEWTIAYIGYTNSSEYGTGMFSYCSNLETIYVGENFVVQNTEAKSNLMFYASKKLKGAISYNSSKVSQDYANTSGYFTLKA